MALTPEETKKDRAIFALEESVYRMIEAGFTPEEVREEFESALENAGEQ